MYVNCYVVFQSSCLCPQGERDAPASVDYHEGLDRNWGFVPTTNCRCAQVAVFDIAPTNTL